MNGALDQIAAQCEVDGIVDLYRRMQRAQGEDFEFLLRDYMNRAQRDPELVARAIEEGALPVG